MSLLNAAKNPALDEKTLLTLIEDVNDLVANAACERLGVAPRPRPVAPAVRIPVIDPKTGRVIR